MLADLVNTGAARMAHVTRMSVLDTLDASNVDCALAHLDVLRLAVEPGAVNGSEALRLLGEIERAVHGRVSTKDVIETSRRREVQCCSCGITSYVALGPSAWARIRHSSVS